MSPEPLPPGQAHLWHCALDSPGALALAEQALGWMNQAERERHDRYLFEASKLEFRITRGLVRSVLARYLGASPASLRFDEGSHGKPSLAGAPLAFNLSNTRGMVVCLVTREVEVGVDVEPLGRQVDARGVAHRFFSPSEVADLFALPDERHHERFLRYWTLKEAYIKACGLGLAIPLDHFSFHLSPDDELRGISFAPERDDHPAAWQFDQRTFGPFMVACALRRGDAPDLAISTHEAAG